MDGRSLHERTVETTIVTGSPPRLANQYLGGFLVLSLELINVLGKDNAKTLSGYKRLPSALTKCLLKWVPDYPVPDYPNPDYPNSRLSKRLDVAMFSSAAGKTRSAHWSSATGEIKAAV